MIKIERKGFVQAMSGTELWVNTLTDEIVKFVVRDRRLRWNTYCKPVKITIEEISEEELRESAMENVGQSKSLTVVARDVAGSSPAILPNIRKTCPVCGNEFDDICMLGGHDHDYCPQCEDEIYEMQKEDLKNGM